MRQDPFGSKETQKKLRHNPGGQNRENLKPHKISPLEELCQAAEECRVWANNLLGEMLSGNPKPKLSIELHSKLVNVMRRFDQLNRPELEELVIRCRKRESHLHTIRRLAEQVAIALENGAEKRVFEKIKKRLEPKRSQQEIRTIRALAKGDHESSELARCEDDPGAYRLISWQHGEHFVNLQPTETLANSGYPLVACRTARRDAHPSLARDPDRNKQSRYCQGFDPDWWMPALLAAKWQSYFYPIAPTAESVNQWRTWIDSLRREFLGPFADPHRAAEMESELENDLALIREVRPELAPPAAPSRQGTDIMSRPSWQLALAVIAREFETGSKYFPPLYHSLITGVSLRDIRPDQMIPNGKSYLGNETRYDSEQGERQEIWFGEGAHPLSRYRLGQKRFTDLGHQTLVILNTAPIRAEVVPSAGNPLLDDLFVDRWTDVLHYLAGKVPGIQSSCQTVNGVEMVTPQGNLWELSTIAVKSWLSLPAESVPKSLPGPPLGAGQQDPPEQVSPTARAIALMLDHKNRTGKLMTMRALLEMMPGTSRSTLYSDPPFRATRKAIKESLRLVIPKGHKGAEGTIEAYSEDEEKEEE